MFSVIPVNKRQKEMPVHTYLFGKFFTKVQDNTFDTTLFICWSSKNK